MFRMSSALKMRAKDSNSKNFIMRATIAWTVVDEGTEKFGQKYYKTDRDNESTLYKYG